MRIDFTVPGAPQGKGRARSYRQGKFIRHYTPEQTVNYENYIKLCFKQASSTFFAMQPLRLCVTAYYPIPTSWGLKKAARAVEGQIRPCVKPDSDNCIKVVCDALNCIAYPDDKNICEINFKKLYGGQPRIEITLEEIEIKT